MPSKGNGDQFQQGEVLILKKESALLSLSGGVDSAVAAFLALESGLHAEAMFLMLQPEDRSLTSLLSAQRIAQKLNIPLHVIEKIKEFNDDVINYFIEGYKRGITPNPCVVCNPRIKFRNGLKLMEKLGLDCFMTGHYARIEWVDGMPVLLKGMDSSKDQSYFLHQIPRKDLSRIKFPLGSLKKDDIKKIALNAGLEAIVQEESQEICFIKGDYRTFLKMSGISFEPGEIITLDGKILGEHNGLHNYTIGQRSGLGIPDATPYYVIALNVVKNQVIIGKEKDLYRDKLFVDDVNWLSDPEEAYQSFCTVKIRYRHQGALARLYPTKDSRVSLEFETPQRAVTPGQYAVFYDGEKVLGGGRICA